MSTTPFLLSVGRPCPDEIRPPVLGVGLNGPPDSPFLVFHEEFTDDELVAIESGQYEIALKLFQSVNVAGLVWRVLSSGSEMTGYADYSLAHVRDRLGDEKLEEFKQSAKGASFAGQPGYGLLLTVVFVAPDTGDVFALRAFTLPRLFSDRFLAAVLATEHQKPEIAAPLVGRLIENGPASWTMARPGIAVAGEELELDEGDWSRRVRRQRQRRRDRT